MPSIIVDQSFFFDKLGIHMDLKELEDTCFAYGLELDDVLNEDNQCKLKFEVPSNRYDLLSVEGIIMTLKLFLGKIQPIQFNLIPSNQNGNFTIYVKPEVASVRPFIVGAILRNVHLTKNAYDSFIDFQDKLHQSVCRKRSLVAIGTHDLDKINGPFTYEAIKPSDIKFIPLNHDKMLDATQIMDLYSNHLQLKQYLHLIRDSPLYPVIYDNNRKVLSLPPIINGDHSKITMDTKNIFIECTANDLHKAGIVIRTLTSIFSEYSTTPYSIESVLVQYDPSHSICANKEQSYPVFENHLQSVSLNRIREIVGVPTLDLSNLQELLNKMGYLIISTQRTDDGDTKIIVDIPFNRCDIMHECDVVEDCAIAYGYEKITSQDHCIMRWQNHSVLSDTIRNHLSLCGLNEFVNWSVCSSNDCILSLNNVESSDENIMDSLPNLLKEKLSLNFEFINNFYADSNKYVDKNQKFEENRYRRLIYQAFNGKPVQIKNPKSPEFSFIRKSLIPGILKSLQSNQQREMPLKIFEVGDVVMVNYNTEVGAENLRHVCAAIADKNCSRLEEIHGIMDTFLEKFGLIADYSMEFSKNTYENKLLHIYSLRPTKHNIFLETRQVDIYINSLGISIGVLATLNPDYLKRFMINFPVSIFELNVEILTELFPENELLHLL